MVMRSSEQPRGRGRPSKFNARRAAIVVRHVRRGCTLDVAARAAGVSYNTMRQWRLRGKSTRPEHAEFRAFREAIRRAEAVAEAKMVRVLTDAAPKEWRAALAWLERRRPERFAKQSTLRVETPERPMIDAARQRMMLADPELRELSARAAERAAQLERMAEADGRRDDD